MTADHARFIAAARLFTGMAPAVAAQRLTGLVYLATPYTRRVNAAGKVNWRASSACAAEAALAIDELSDLGITAVSPILLAHHACHQRIARVGLRQADARALDGEFWTGWCAPLLAACRSVYVPELPGWQRSAGAAFEIEAALDAGKVVVLEGRL